MYWEGRQSARHRGLFLHGGPGAGATPAHRRFFDPGYYRIVIFDQRGAGRSTPLGESPTTRTPIWSPTSKRCASSSASRAGWCSAARGARPWRWPMPRRIPSAAWAWCCAASSCAGERDRLVPLRHRRVFPEAWRAFAGFLPGRRSATTCSAAITAACRPDPPVHMPAARAWSIYEGACSTLLPNPETVAAFGEDRLALGLARIEAHYFRHTCSCGEDDLIGDVDASAHCPGTIVQGRYEWSARSAAPRTGARLAGGGIRGRARCRPSAMEPGIREQLVLATEQMKRPEFIGCTCATLCTRR